MEKTLGRDELLLQLNGDSSAEKVLFQKYVHRVLGLARGELRGRFTSKIDPEDIVQSVFRSFFRRVGQGEFHVENGEQLWGLLALITVRKCRCTTRKLLGPTRDVRREVDRHADRSGNERDVPSRDPAVADELAVDEILELLLVDLNSMQREVVLLKLLGYSNREISKLIRRTERTVGRVIALIRERLRQMVST